MFCDTIESAYCLNTSVAKKMAPCSGGIPGRGRTPAGLLRFFTRGMLRDWKMIHERMNCYEEEQAKKTFRSASCGGADHFCLLPERIGSR